MKSQVINILIQCSVAVGLGNQQYFTYINCTKNQTGVIYFKMYAENEKNPIRFTKIRKFSQICIPI